MSNKYITWSRRRQEMYNNMPYIEFAFGTEQAEKVFANWGLKYPEDKDKCCSIIGCGDIIQKKDVEAFHRWERETLKTIEDEKLELLKDKQFCKDMFMYEMQNHEWQITLDNLDVITACGLTAQQIADSPVLMAAWKEAKAEYWQKCLDNDWF